MSDLKRYVQMHRYAKLLAVSAVLYSTTYNGISTILIAVLAFCYTQLFLILTHDLKRTVS